MNTFNENRRYNKSSDAGRDGKSHEKRSFHVTNKGDSPRSNYNSDRSENRNQGNYRKNDRYGAQGNQGNQGRPSWNSNAYQSDGRNRSQDNEPLKLRKNPGTTSDGKPKRTRQRISKTGASKVVRFEQNDSYPIRNFNRDENYNPRSNFIKNKPFESKKSFFDPEVPIRLNRYLANSGVCSRREADEYIQAGVISVNGEIVKELGAKVLPTDNIQFNEQAISIERKIYLLLNKPKDFVTTAEDTHGRKTVMDIVKNACSERIYPVGRLDRNTTGVLLFTNDGDLATKLTHPKYDKKKIYHVRLSHDLTAEHYEMIINGIELGDDLKIKADSLEFVKDNNLAEVGIEIHSGQNRIVRRIFESLGYRVLRLDRVYFAGLTKRNLPRGKYRFLTEKEVGILKMGAYE